MLIRNKNVVIAYVCLVGIPVLAVIGILDAGYNLRAPIAVGGTWDVQGDLHALATAPCAASLGNSQPRVLEISQSGKYLSFSFDAIRGSARLEGTTIAAGELWLPRDAECGN